MRNGVRVSRDYIAPLNISISIRNLKHRMWCEYSVQVGTGLLHLYIELSGLHTMKMEVAT